VVPPVEVFAERIDDFASRLIGFRRDRREAVSLFALMLQRMSLFLALLGSTRLL
jgi:hypothetical protein